MSGYCKNQTADTIFILASGYAFDYFIGRCIVFLCDLQLFFFADIFRSIFQHQRNDLCVSTLLSCCGVRLEIFGCNQFLSAHQGQQARALDRKIHQFPSIGFQVFQVFFAPLCSAVCVFFGKPKSSKFLVVRRNIGKLINM